MKKTDTASTLNFNEADLNIIRAMLGEKASEDQFQRFVRTCERTGLDPITRQIYGRLQATNHKKRRGSEWIDNWVDELVIITGIDGFRAIAERTGQYLGQTTPEFFFKDSSLNLEEWAWRDFWIGNGKDHPEVARVGVRRADFPEPVYGVARYNSYAQYQGSGENRKLTPFWYKMPEVLLAKCAEALAFRKTFPILSGLYLEEEVAADKQAEDETPAAPAPVIERETVRIIKPGEQVNDPPRRLIPPVESSPTENDNLDLAQRAASETAAEPPDPLFATDAEEAARTAQRTQTHATPPETPTAPPKAPKATRKPAAPKTEAAPADTAKSAPPAEAGWRDHKVEQLRVGKFCGKTLGELAKNPADIKAAFEGWAQKYFPQLKGDPIKRHEAEMMLAAYTELFPEDTANHTLEPKK